MSPTSYQAAPPRDTLIIVADWRVQRKGKMAAVVRGSRVAALQAVVQ